MIFVIFLFLLAFFITAISLIAAVGVAGGSRVRWRNTFGMAVGVCFVLVVLEVFILVFAARLSVPPLLLAILGYLVVAPVFMLSYGLSFVRSLGVAVVMVIVRQTMIVGFCLLVRGPTEFGFCQQLFF